MMDIINDAETIAERMSMSPQEEGGMVLENHYPSKTSGRAQSGQSYYYVAPNVATAFHRLDCDEYWTYHAGSELEVWIIDEEGNLTRELLGISEASKPCIYFQKGCVFASKHLASAETGTLMSCITVPRFSQEGLCILSKTEVIDLCQDAGDFFSCP